MVRFVSFFSGFVIKSFGAFVQVSGYLRLGYSVFLGQFGAFFWVVRLYYLLFFSKDIFFGSFRGFGYVEQSRGFCFYFSAGQVVSYVFLVEFYIRRGFRVFFCIFVDFIYIDVFLKQGVIRILVGFYFRGQLLLVEFELVFNYSGVGFWTRFVGKTVSEGVETLQEELWFILGFSFTAFN